MSSLTGAAVSKYMTACPHTVAAEQPLERAHEIMRKYNIRHLPVLHGGKLLGVVSNRDLYFVETMKDVDPKTISIEEAMTSEPYVVAATTPLAEVAGTMAERHIGCAIITENDHVVGIFTTVDALRAVADAAK
jgi:acetoin utilization protein AcuB